MNRPLLAASILLAVFWTLGMYFWMLPEGASGVIVLIVAGILFGLFWYGAMGWWMRRNKAGRNKHASGA
jgi:hypothetical protein